MSALTGLPIETTFGARPTGIDDAAQTVVLRVVQEALQNVRKHATASRVTVASRMAGDDWILEVRDDGRGFDVGSGRRPWQKELRTAIHARTGGADRRPISKSGRVPPEGRS